MDTSASTIKPRHYVLSTSRLKKAWGVFVYVVSPSTESKQMLFPSPRAVLANIATNERGAYGVHPKVGEGFIVDFPDGSSAVYWDTNHLCNILAFRLPCIFMHDKYWAREGGRARPKWTSPLSGDTITFNDVTMQFEHSDGRTSPFFEEVA